MPGFIQWTAPIAIVLVAAVLLLGLVNMARGGPGRRSQMIMRWRVVLQFAAIVVMMTGLFLTTR